MPAWTWTIILKNKKHKPAQDQKQKFGATTSSNQEPQICLLEPGQRLRAGMRCPRCKKGMIDYNGMLNLVCPNCGLTEAGACT